MPPPSLRPLEPTRLHELAEALGDTPETVIPVHKLRRGLCQAALAGEPSRFVGAVVQLDSIRSEPFAFGTDPEAIWRLLGSMNGWHSVNVAPELAEPLGVVIERESGASVRYYGDIYHTMSAAAELHHRDDVRRFTAGDLSLLEGSWFRGDFEGMSALLRDGAAAGAVVSGALLSVAHTNALTNRYADIGVRTLDPWQGRGYATASASVVARWVQKTGRTPVWSAGEDNYASLRIARKLSFAEVSRRVYINVRTRE